MNHILSSSTCLHMAHMQIIKVNQLVAFTLDNSIKNVWGRNWTKLWEGVNGIDLEVGWGGHFSPFTMGWVKIIGGGGGNKTQLWEVWSKKSVFPSHLCTIWNGKAQITYNWNLKHSLFCIWLGCKQNSHVRLSVSKMFYI